MATRSRPCFDGTTPRLSNDQSPAERDWSPASINEMRGHTTIGELTVVEAPVTRQSLAPLSSASVPGKRDQVRSERCTSSSAGRPLVIRWGVGLAIAALGMGAAIALPVLASEWIASQPALNAPPPPCPSGTHLYARSVLGGKLQSTIYHCFRDLDEREDKSFGQGSYAP